MLKTKDNLIKSLNPHENGGYRSSDNRMIIESIKVLSEEILTQMQLYCLAGSWKVDCTHLGMAWCCLSADPKLTTARACFENGRDRIKEHILTLNAKRDAFDIARSETELRCWNDSLRRLEELER